MSLRSIFTITGCSLMLFGSCQGCTSKDSEESQSISLQQNEITLPAQSSSKSVKVTASAAWTASSDAQWCKAVKSSDAVMIMAENNDGAARQASVTVQCGTAQDILTVNQQAKSVSLTVSPTDFLVNATPSSQTLNIYSDTEWSISSSEDFITVSPQQGEGDGSVTVLMEQNHKDEIRTATLTITYTDASEQKTVSVPVTQKAVLGAISLSDKELSFDHNASEQTVTLTVTGQWQATLSAPCDWLSITPVSGVSGDHTITISVEANESKTDERKATVRFNAPSSKFVNLTVTQSPRPITTYTLNLMSYNVHNCIGTDGVFDAFRVSNAVRSYSPDCIAIQEVDSMTSRNETKNIYVLGTLSRFIDPSMKSVFYPTLDSYRGGKYGIGMISKEEAVSYTGMKIPYTSEERGILMVEFEKFWYICTHFDAGEDKRLEAAQIISQLAAELSKDKVVFLAGDLNATPTEACIRHLKENFTPLNDTSLPTAGYADSPGNNRCIDYIFIYNTVNGAPVDYQITEREIIQNTSASDHYPLYVKILITEP